MSGELPEVFRCELVDDALAPNTPKGTPIVFARNAAPYPGVGVLVEDRDGVRYVRVYTQGAAGHWMASARHPAYVSLDSEQHGLKLLAVAQHRLLGGEL